jgi:competence protein ComGC
MKKLRLIIRIITGILIVITISGIALLIINPNRDPLDTTYEVIAFSLGSAGMVMAVVAQIDSYQNEKQSKKLLSKIESLNRDHDEDERVDKEFQRKLDILVKMDNKIYHELEESKKPQK